MINTPIAQPRLIDNDQGEISVKLNGKEIRGWSYDNVAQQRIKMIQAREYIEGWYDGYMSGWIERPPE